MKEERGSSQISGSDYYQEWRPCPSTSITKKDCPPLKGLKANPLEAYAIFHASEAGDDDAMFVVWDSAEENPRWKQWYAAMGCGFGNPLGDGILHERAGAAILIHFDLFELANLLPPEKLINMNPKELQRAKEDLIST